MPEARGTIQGSHTAHAVIFYGLSTCIWCKRSRKFLEEQNVSFDFVYVDLLGGDERKAAVEEIASWNPGKNFPTIVIDGKDVVVGYRPEKLREMLGL
jgi:glutaredoxin-like protein NrdH